MRFSKTLAFVVLLFSLGLAACAGQSSNQVPATGGTANPATPEAMMSTPTTKAMASTPEAMMTPQASGTPAGAMMEGTPTGEAMMATPTGEMMANTPEAMMGTPTSEAMMATPTGEAMMSTGTPQAGMMGQETQTPGAMMQSPAWFSTTLTDALTGKPFMINDFKGKVIVVQNLSSSCAACTQQTQQIKALQGMLGGSSSVAFVGLDTSANEDAAALKAYAEKNGFSGNYAVVSKDAAAELGKLYGSAFLNPAAAPLLIIDPHGEAHLLPAGLQSVDALKKAIQMYSGM